MVIICSVLMAIEHEAGGGGKKLLCISKIILYPIAITPFCRTVSILVDSSKSGVCSLKRALLVWVVE